MTKTEINITKKSQEVIPFPAAYHKAATNRRESLPALFTGKICPDLILADYEEKIYANILKRKSFATLTKMLFPFFEPNFLLHDIVINKANDMPSKQHENQTNETYDCRSSTRNVRQPKFEKSQLQYLTFNRGTVLHHFTFDSEKVFNHYLFSKAEGQTSQSRLFYAFVNVHYVNVKPSIFDVISRLSTTEYQ